MLSTILEAALRSIALAIPAAIIARIFLRAHPRLELTLWTLVLLGAVAMPVAMQRAPIALLPPYLPPTQALSLSAPEAVVENIQASADMASQVGQQPARGRPESALASSPRLDWRLVAGMVYALVAVLMASRMALGLALAWRRWQSAKRLDGRGFAGRDVRVVSGLTAPTTFGRAILLPVDSAAWSETTWRAVLAHECSHIRRGDFF